uniref:Pentatricopeptide repeat-containing protein n=1 Tax=Fagus sylvatica TaxID=28930 RepID=A0A2N9FJ44_FAGSY
MTNVYESITIGVRLSAKLDTTLVAMNSGQNGFEKQAPETQFQKSSSILRIHTTTLFNPISLSPTTTTTTNSSHSTPHSHSLPPQPPPPPPPPPLTSTPTSHSHSLPPTSSTSSNPSSTTTLPSLTTTSTSFTGPPLSTPSAMTTPRSNGWHVLSPSLIVSSTLPPFSNSWPPIPALARMKLIDGRPSVALYNILIHGFVKCGEHCKALQVYDKMIKDRVKPDVYTFNILISSYCRNKRFGLALELFKEMREKGCSPNVVSFNTLIRGFFRERKFDEGIAMAYEMVELGCEFSRVTCEILVDGLCRDGRDSEACELLIDFSRRGVLPDGYDYYSLMEVLCGKGNAGRALEVVDELWRKGNVPSLIACTTLIEGLRRLGRIDEAFRLTERMLRGSLVPDSVTFNCVLQGLCDVGRTVEANRLRLLASSKGLDSDGMAYVERAERKERAQVGGCTEGLNRHDVPCCFSSTCTVELSSHGRKRDKAFLTLLYSTLSSPVIAMVVRKSTSQEVWNTLEERIKTIRDKLSAVGVHSDHKELLHVILKGLPKEYAPFASAIRTRDRILPLEKLLVLLQIEEQSLNETFDSLSNFALAMFVSRTNLQMVSMAIRVSTEEETGTTILKAEEANSGASDHITASANNLSPQVPYQGQEQVSVGNGQNQPIQNIGYTYGEATLQAPE